VRNISLDTDYTVRQHRIAKMERTPRAGCSDEYNDALRSPHEEELLSKLDGEMKNIVEVVNGVKAAVSAIPDIQNDIEHIKKTLAELLSYSKSIAMALGSSAAKGLPLFDEKISKQLLPVSKVFTAEYVGLAASSTMPKFLHTQALLVDLQEDREGARCIMAAILFSAKASDKKITKYTKIACLHADLKSLIAKVLMVNCSTRAPKIARQTPQSESASFSVEISENDAVRSENSLPSPTSSALQAEWMKSGYIRPEIYEEVRHELDGNGGTTEYPSVRTKKRRLDPESEFRDHVSRALLKKIYPLINMFFRHGRFQAKRLFFDHLGCLLCENARPYVELNECTPRGSIAEIELTHPLVGSNAAADDDQKNKKLVSQAEDSWKEFHFIVQYRVNVKDGEKNESKVARRSISALTCALNFCVALSQCENPEKFLRSSTYALRMAYIVAVTFRCLLVDLRELYPIRGHNPSEVEYEEFVTRWSFFMPGIDSLKNLQHEGLASMDVNKYNELCAAAGDGSDESSASNLDEEDCNDVERAVQDIVIQP
jgi:hypothetical protein